MKRPLGLADVSEHVVEIRRIVAKAEEAADLELRHPVFAQYMERRRLETMIGLQCDAEPVEARRVGELQGDTAPVWDRAERIFSAHEADLGHEPEVTTGLDAEGG